MPALRFFGSSYYVRKIFQLQLCMHGSKWVKLHGKMLIISSVDYVVLHVGRYNIHKSVNCVDFPRI